MSEPIGGVPLSFEEWISAFEIKDKEERVRVFHAAGRLLKDSLVKRVLCELEIRAYADLSRCPIGATDKIQDAKMRLFGVQAFKASLRSMAANAKLEPFDP